jgi:hypothetical protein
MVTKAKDESPVEVPFAGQRPVVGVRLLGVVFSHHPPADTRGAAGIRKRPHIIYDYLYNNYKAEEEEVGGTCGTNGGEEECVYIRFEIFTAVTMKNGVIWDVTPCGSCKNRRFGGT